MTTSECESLCEAAGLNVRAVTQTAHHLIAQVGKDKRSSQTVITRLRKLAKDRGIELGGIIFSESPTGDDEYYFRERA